MINYYQILLLICFLSLCNLSIAQMTDYSLLKDIVVVENNDTLNSPFMGGFFLPQFNNLELNQDSISDIIVFDRIDQRILPFIQEDNQFYYNDSYTTTFPPINNFLLIRDYNCDGIQDLFTSTAVNTANAHIVAYKGTINSDGTYSFEIQNFHTTNDSLLTINPLDIPTKDIDKEEMIPMLNEMAAALAKLLDYSLTNDKGKFASIKNKNRTFCGNVSLSRNKFCH